MGWALAMQGGGGNIPRSLPPDITEPRLATLRRCLDLGAAALRAGQPALDVVELVVRELENCPHFNAGRGSVLTADGTVEMEACIMEGLTLRCGAVRGGRLHRRQPHLAGQARHGGDAAHLPRLPRRRGVRQGPRPGHPGRRPGRLLHHGRQRGAPQAGAGETTTSRRQRQERRQPADRHRGLRGRRRRGRAGVGHVHGRAHQQVGRPDRGHPHRGRRHLRQRDVRRVRHGRRRGHHPPHRRAGRRRRHGAPRPRPEGRRRARRGAGGRVRAGGGGHAAQHRGDVQGLRHPGWTHRGRHLAAGFAFTGPRISPPPRILSRPLYSDPRLRLGWRSRQMAASDGGEAEALKEQDAASRLEAAAVAEHVLGLPDHGDCSAPAVVRGCRNGMPGSPEHGVATQEASFRRDATPAPKSTARQQLGGAGDCYYYRKRRDPKRGAARSSKAAVSSKRSSSRDLSDQLEAHARRLLMDAGWRIKPRIRKDRPRVAYYFTAPQREAVLASLSQAWRLCGQRLRSASGGLELGQCPAEWSDVDQFWKDLVDAMDSVGNMAVDGSATLLRRWQVLDPFVAVVFIDKRITALQKQKRIRAIDSSTCFVDCYGDNRPSTGKPTTTSPCSGHQHMMTIDTEVSGQAENHIQLNAEPAHSYSGANLDNTLVKRVRKKSIWLSDFESTGLNGLYAQSFMRHFVPSSESGSCLVGNGTLKKHVKSRNESMPLESNGCSVAKSTVTESDAKKDASAKKQQCRSRKQSPARGLSEHVLTVSDVSNVVVKSCEKHNATMVECSNSLEAQSHKEPTIASKSEVFEKQAKKRPFEMHFNDDDLLIAAIVKKRDISSCRKNELRLVSSKAKFRKLKSSKKDSRLLIRKGGTDVLDGRQIVLARKTVLCWLIATGFVTLKDVVQYRNPENNEVLKDGWVTWDGILCSCCSKTLSISDFKAHAMISLPRSSLNLCLQSGKSFTLCQIEAWNAEYMDRRSNACRRKVEAADGNDDTCGFCGDGGELLCCDNCPSTYHQSCLSVKELPDDSWYCHNCICRICGCPVTEKEISSFSAIIKCLQCGAAHHDTCVEMGATAFEEMDSDEWFCGTHCKEIYLGLHGCVGVESSLGDGLSWTILRCNSGGQKMHSVQKIAHAIECNSKLAVALTLMEECFAQMVDTRTGINMIPHVLYNQGSKYARLNYQGFYTVILEKGEEILCAASIRVHGMKAAELPFIATCREHRRKGMCRRLINTIEEMLKSFHVKMLVLSAIPELVSTWVSGFGFKPIEEYERKQLDTINLMLFPGTSLLIKSLEDGTLTEKSGAGNDTYDVLGLPDDYCFPNGNDNEHFEEVGSDFIESHKEKLAAENANLQNGIILPS